MGKICRGLPPSCKSLDLAACGLSNAACMSIAQSLKNLAAGLRQLNLADNEINSTGAKMLADMLENNHGLQELVLNLNRIEDDGVAALVRCMGTSNTSLQYLDLVANYTSAADIAQIEEMTGLVEQRLRAERLNNASGKDKDAEPTPIKQTRYEQARVFTACYSLENRIVLAVKDAAPGQAEVPKVEPKGRIDL